MSSHGFTKIDNRAIHALAESKISSTDFAVYAAARSFSDGRGRMVSPKRQTLCKRVGLKNVSSISLSFARLKVAGLITYHDRPGRPSLLSFIDSDPSVSINPHPVQNSNPATLNSVDMRNRFQRQSNSDSLAEPEISRIQDQPVKSLKSQEYFSQDRLRDECETSRAEAEQMPPAAQGSQTLENPVRTPSIDGEPAERGSACDPPAEVESSPEQRDSQTGFQRDRIPWAVGDTPHLASRQRQHLAEAVASCPNGEDRLALIQADIAARAEGDRPIANPVGYTLAALRDPAAYPLDAGKRWQERQAEHERVEAMKQRARVEREERLREEAASQRAEDQAVRDLERFKKRNPEEYAALWEQVCEEVAALPSVVTLRLTPGRPMFDRMVRDRVVARLGEPEPGLSKEKAQVAVIVQSRRHQPIVDSAFQTF